MVSTSASGFTVRRSRLHSGQGIRVSKLLHVNTPGPRQRELAAAAAAAASCWFSSLLLLRMCGMLGREESLYTVSINVTL